MQIFADFETILLILQLVLLILKQTLQLLSLLIVSTYEVAQKKKKQIFGCLAKISYLCSRNLTRGLSPCD